MSQFVLLLQKVLTHLNPDFSLVRNPGVVKNSNSPANALELLANDKTHLIRELVAGHKNTPIHILEKLANNKYEKIRTTVGVGSPHSSPPQNP
jgi:hypothetical protein